MIFASIMSTLGASFFMLLGFIHIGPIGGTITLHIVSAMLYMCSGMIAGEALRMKIDF
jgi:hypothetical protein